MYIESIYRQYWMLVDTCLYDVYYNLGTASWERWVFLDAHVGVHELMMDELVS